MATGEFVGAVQILTKGKSGFVLAEKALLQVLSHANDLPVYVVSICGDCDTGKSFLLNLYMQHLEEYYSTKRNASSIGKSKKFRTVFDWNDGSTNGTEGVWISSKPFIVETERCKVALYVVDSPGTNGYKTSRTECDKMLRFVMLMSSCVIYNSMQQIKTKDIESLVHWKVCANGEYENPESYCQKLLFLIRDFPNPDYGYGTTGGDKYMNKTFHNTRPSVEGENGIGNLKTMYKSTGAFAIPRPSHKLTEKKQDSKSFKLDVIGDSFMRYANELFAVLDRNVKPVRVSEALLTGKDLTDYMLTVGKHVLGNETQPVPAISEFFRDNVLSQLCSKEIASYQKKMEQILGGFYGEIEQLQVHHEGAMRRALQSFDQSQSSGGERTTARARNSLEARITKQFKVFARSYKAMDEGRARTVQLRRETEDHIAEVRQRVHDRRMEPVKADALAKKVQSLQIRLLAAQEDQENENAKAKQLIRQKNTAIADIRQELEEQRRILSANPLDGKY